MSRIEIISANLSHVQELGRTMNREHILEYEGIGQKSHRALWRSWKRAVIRKTAIVDGEVGAIWGVGGSFIGLIGYPFLVTSPKAREVNPHEFASIYRTEVRKMLELFPILENWVDNTYIGAIKLLKLSEFSLDEPIPIGKMKRLYRRFYKVA